MREIALSTAEPPMPIWNRTARQLITVRSRIGLGLIGLIVTVSFVLTTLTIQRHQQRVEIIEYAAKQRMYSQRIPFLANEMAATEDPDLRQIYRRDLEYAVEGMSRRHEILSLRDKKVRVPEDFRAILTDVYYSDLYPLDAQMERFLNYVNSFLKLEDDKLPSGNSLLARITNLGTDPLLESHELTYRLLRRETQSALHKFIVTEAVLWVLTLSILILEVPLIFGPMAGHAAEKLRGLDAARRIAEQRAAAAQANYEDNLRYLRLMGHELRTPLNVILGMTALLRMGNLPRKQEEYAQQIENSGQHLLALTNQVLQFRELEANVARIRLDRTFIPECLERICSHHRPNAEEKGLKFTCSSDDRLAARYWADGDNIRQALNCLVENAIKYTDEGLIEIRAVLDGEAGRSTDRVRFEVEDSGIGVPESLKDHVFREWRQVEGTMARKYGGLGLGLAIARRLVKLMEGEIGLDRPQKGKGSLFWFTLPLERADEADEPDENLSPRSV